ncbi:hypothetical protein PybrP1_000191 [[Pythium] brassicae (nom. inval.)]|nr:hypothetical protein PybrP1_000191 [[Pythium] brassicae (nom. inval.)]
METASHLPRQPKTATTSPVTLGSEAHWLLSAAGKWTEEDEKAWKREQHRENMVSFRLKKKEQRTQLKAQHRGLEAQLKQKLAIQRAAAARGARLASATLSAANHRSSIMSSSPILDKSFLTRPLHQAAADLVVEKEALRRENAALAAQIGEHMKLQKMIQKEAELLSSDEEAEPPRADSESPAAASASVLATSGVGTKGSFVTVDDGSPAFFYEPISAQDRDHTMRRYREGFSESPPKFFAGTMFGWRVERALTRDAVNGAFFSRVWYTKRIECPGRDAAVLLPKIESASWRVLADPSLYAKIHRQELQSKHLQQFHDGSFVAARNTFDPRFGVHLRYLNLMARDNDVNAAGQRRLNQYLVITDSSANRVARAADPHRNVKWILDGGGCVSFICVDDTTLEVVYDHFTHCPDPRMADYFMIEWCNTIVRWEQLVHPPNMLVSA